MKKLVSILISVIVFYLFFIVLIKSTNFKGEQVYVQYNNEGLSQFADSLVAKKIIFEKTSFLLIAKVFQVEDKIKPGKFLVKRKTNLIDIIRMLRNNRQATVKLVLNKVRTKGEFAKLIATAFDKDSASVMTFLSSNDSLKAFDTDTTQLFTLLIPNTYEFYWDVNSNKLADKMAKEYKKFWNHERLEKAAAKSLTPIEVSVLASIVHKETAKADERATVAGVYLNRLKTGIPLQADPTIIFAIKKETGDFDQVIKRVYHNDLKIKSPYNTYINRGLPPGPIYMPDFSSIESVLEMETHEYLFFVADVKRPGYHIFAKTYRQHNKNKRQYTNWLKKNNIRR